MSFPIYRHDMPWYGALERTDRHVDPYRDEKRASIWKRELSIGRRSTRNAIEPIEVTAATIEPSDAETVETDETVKRTPLWKRELSFGRRKTDGAESHDSHSDDAQPTVEPEHSWWSSRSDEGEAHAETETEFVAVPHHDRDDDKDDDHGDDDAPADELPPAAEKQSIWKRDLPLGRRKRADEERADVDPVAEPLADTPAFDEQAAEATEPTADTADVEVLQDEPDRPSIWKRELSFGRRKARAATDWEFDVADAVDAEDADEVHTAAPYADATQTGLPHDVEPEAVEITEPVSEAPTAGALASEPGSFEIAPTEAPSFEAPSFEAPSVDAPSFDAPSSEASSLEAPSFEIAAEDAYAPAAPVDEPAHSSLDDSFAPLVDPDLGGPADDASAEDDRAGVPRKERKRLSIGGRRGPRTEKTPKAPKTPKAAKAAKSSKGPKSPSGGKKIVGLKIGASQISAAHVHSNGSLEVLKMARTPLERGIVVAGELRDPDALGVALKAFFNDNKLPKRNVRLGIASNRVGVRVLDVEGVDDPALLGNAVRFRAQEVLPIPLSEAVLDYRVLRERRDEEGNLTREVLVAFAYRELVDRYASVCRSAGLRLVGIDLDGFALLRALVDPVASGANLGGAAVVTVALGHDRSIMSVSDGEVCEFTRVIEWGGSSLDTAVARILALTPSQAEPIKRALSLDRHAPVPEGLSPEQAGRARSAMVQEVHAFAREFVSSLQFYQAQPRSLDIGEIVITGGMAHMAGLAQQLQELIGVAVRVGDPLGRVKLAKNVTSDESIGSFALAIGLGIED